MPFPTVADFFRSIYQDAWALEGLVRVNAKMAPPPDFRASSFADSVERDCEMASKAGEDGKAAVSG